MNIPSLLYSTVNTLRDKYTPLSHTSTFRQTGQITPEEFVAAGDYLVFKFPTWSWADADPTSKRVSYLPAGKQFLVTRNVPCHRRINDDFAGDAGHEESIVERGGAKGGAGGDDEDGWLRTGSTGKSELPPAGSRARDVRTVDDSGNLGERESYDDYEDDIPDMEDEDDDEAIIKDTEGDGKANTRRTYTLYIMYSTYYRTPRLYMSGYASDNQPLPPILMMEDIVGDYKDKTVTLEDFPFFANNIKMASVHPCKHAAVMKTLLDRADAALRLRKEKVKAGLLPVRGGREQGMEGLVEEVRYMDISSGGGAAQGSSSATAAAAAAAQDKLSADDWEEVQNEGDDDDVAIRVDQYLVVFLKFIASVTPGIEHDFTMAV